MASGVLFWSADVRTVDLPFAFAGRKPGSICSDAVKTFEAPKRSQLTLQKIATCSGTKQAAVSDWELAKPVYAGTAADRALILANGLNVGAIRKAPSPTAQEPM